MKKLLFFILIGAVAFSSCKKTGSEANPFSDVKNLGIGSYLILNKTNNLNLDYANFNASTVGIEVDQYAGGEAVDKIEIWAVKGASVDPTTWKKVKTVTFAGANTKLSVNGAELAAAYGLPVSSFSPGTTYTFYNRLITKSGRKFDVTNTGNNNGSGLITGNNYNSAFSFQAAIVCPFVAPMAGTYKVITDEWADWSADDLVQVTDGPGANQLNLSQVYPGAYGTNSATSTPLVINVDPPTGAATLTSGVTWGHYVYTSGGTNYDYLATTLSGSGGFVFSCTGVITVTIHISLSAGYGDQGNFKLTLQKQ